MADNDVYGAKKHSGEGHMREKRDITRTALTKKRFAASDGIDTQPRDTVVLQLHHVVKAHDLLERVLPWYWGCVWL